MTVAGNICCKKNEGGTWCKDERTKRSLFGLGARLCLISQGRECPYQDKYERPKPPKGQKCKP